MPTRHSTAQLLQFIEDDVAALQESRKPEEMAQELYRRLASVELPIAG
jgi:hypothetical protein